MVYQDMINELLSDPDKLIQKKPFTRGMDMGVMPACPRDIEQNTTIAAYLPRYREEIVTQEQFMQELDPNSHSVLFDDNIPSICIKTENGGYKDIKFLKMAIPFQRNIKNKQLLHLTGNKMKFTLVDTNPTQVQTEAFITFKQYWDLRNQDGMKTKMVDSQLSLGDAGLLYYFNRHGEIKSRLLSYADGFVLCPHNDQNGDRILESVYYRHEDVEYIDSYDDKYMYRHIRNNDVVNGEDVGWKLIAQEEHGFEEIPLITKRGKVAWDNVQSIIESYEILYNVFNAIQRRLGWGLLYIKGKLKETAKKIAGSVVLNDSSIEGKGDAKFLTPPTPEGTIDTLQLMLDNIQLGSSTTFLLPKDVKVSGDISGIAIQLTQSLDIENALQKVIEWQNVADKMVRLFKYGLAVELTKKGNTNALNNFASLNINGQFTVWKPMNDYEYNQMLTIMTGAGILSKETGIQRNTESAPDENIRVRREKEEERAYHQSVLQAQQQNSMNSNGE